MNAESGRYHGCVYIELGVSVPHHQHKTNKLHSTKSSLRQKDPPPGRSNFAVTNEIEKGKSNSSQTAVFGPVRAQVSSK